MLSDAAMLNGEDDQHRSAPMTKVAFRWAVANPGIWKVSECPGADGGRQGGDGVRRQQSLHGIRGGLAGIGGEPFGYAR